MSGEILITLINNALDAAKLDANKLELDSQFNDIFESLTKSVNLFVWKARERKVNLKLAISQSMPQIVEVDESRLTQILINLIGNAVKFSNSFGDVQVNASFIPDENSDYFIKNSELKDVPFMSMKE